jgi:hypothetical protein
LMMLEHPWITHQFVHSTPGELESNFVSSVFVIYVMFLFVYSCQFLGYFLIYYLLCFYNVDFWYVSIHVFYIKEQIRISLLSSMDLDEASNIICVW